MLVLESIQDVFSKEGSQCEYLQLFVIDTSREPITLPRRQCHWSTDFLHQPAELEPHG